MPKLKALKCEDCGRWMYYNPIYGFRCHAMPPLEDEMRGSLGVMLRPNLVNDHVPVADIRDNRDPIALSKQIERLASRLRVVRPDLPLSQVVQYIEEKTLTESTLSSSNDKPIHTPSLLHGNERALERCTCFNAGTYVHVERTCPIHGEQDGA